MVVPHQHIAIIHIEGMHVRMGMKDLLKSIFSMSFSSLGIQPVWNDCNSPVLKDSEVTRVIRVIPHTFDKQLI